MVSRSQTSYFHLILILLHCIVDFMQFCRLECHHVMRNYMTRFNPSGSAGDSLSYHRDRPWSTPDQDNDEWLGGNCAEHFHGAWWYKKCSRSNLNGRYHRGNDSSYAHGVTWREKQRKRERRFLKRTEMKIRPADF